MPHVQRQDANLSQHRPDLHLEDRSFFTPNALLVCLCVFLGFCGVFIRCWISIGNDIKRLHRRPASSILCRLRPTRATCWSRTWSCTPRRKRLAQDPVGWGYVHQVTVSTSVLCETRLLDCRLVPIPLCLPAHWQISLPANIQLGISEQTLT